MNRSNTFLSSICLFYMQFVLSKNRYYDISGIVILLHNKPGTINRARERNFQYRPTALTALHCCSLRSAGNRTTRGQTNSPTANSHTSQVADKSTRRQVRIINYNNDVVGRQIVIICFHKLQRYLLN